MPNPFYATITFIPRPDSIERRLRMLRTKKAPPSKRKTIAARHFIVNPDTRSGFSQNHRPESLAHSSCIPSKRRVNRVTIFSIK